jgi:TRAP-type C4-dicarboxylate transport system permease small subunit
MMAERGPRLARAARLYGLLLAGPAAVAGVLVLGMVLLITASIAQRAMTGTEIAGTVELTEIGLYLSTVLAAPWLLNKGQHIRADLLGAALPPGPARLLEAASDLLGLVACLVLVWVSWGAAAQSAATGALVRRTFTYPEWWLVAPLPLCFALLAGEFGFRLLRLVADPAAPRRDETRSVA